MILILFGKNLCILNMDINNQKTITLHLSHFCQGGGNKDEFTFTENTSLLNLVKYIFKSNLKIMSDLDKECFKIAQGVPFLFHSKNLYLEIETDNLEITLNELGIEKGDVISTYLKDEVINVLKNT